MGVFQDVFETNKEVLHKTFNALIKNWKIIFVGIVYGVIGTLLIPIASMFSIFAGILISIIQSALCSNFLYLIENIIRYDRITIDDFKAGFKVYLWKIYSVIVVIWLVNYAGGLVLGSILNIRIGFVSIWMIIQLIAFVFLNCLPEVIYQKYYDTGESLSYSFGFIKENWLEWFVPNAIIGAIGYMMIFLIKGSTFGLITSIFASFIMIYRGFLFEILSTTSRRKRMFKRNMYK